MNYTEIEKDISINDIPETYSDIAHVIGIKSLLALAGEYGGLSLYLPTKKELLKRYIYRKIKAEYNGENKRFLSRKYNVSESTIYRIIKNQS